MTKKNPGHTFPLCKKCGVEYEAYGAAGHARHMKVAHPAEWADYKENVLMPNLKKAVGIRMTAAEKKRRKKQTRRQVMEQTATESPAATDPDPASELDAEPPDPDPIQKPGAGSMPRQIFSVVLPPDMTGDDEPDIMEALLPQSDVRTGSATLKPVRTDRFAEANVFAYVPKVFSFSSVLLHAAWQVTVQAWGWDPDEPMGKWLDRYLFMTMERLGIRLMAYQVIEPVGGNGHGESQQIGVPVLHAGDEGTAPVEPWPR